MKKHKTWLLSGTALVTLFTEAFLAQGTKQTSRPVRVDRFGNVRAPAEHIHLDEVTGRMSGRGDRVNELVNEAFPSAQMT